MSRYIDAEELKRHIAWDSGLDYEKRKIINAIIDKQTDIKPFDRDNGAEPILEQKTSTHHESLSDGTGRFVTTSFLDWTCPQCGWFVGELYCGYGIWHVQGEKSYCAKCGQKIDWTKPKAEEKRRYEEEQAKRREEYHKKNGIRLDNMNENKRRKYGMLNE